MNEVQIITNGYKKQFIDEILNGMEHFLDNSQLMELNKSLNHHTNNLTITEAPSNIDLDFKKTNQILIKDFLKHKKLEGLSPRTLNYYESQLNIIQKWTIKSFIEMNADDLKEYLTYYKEWHNCSNTTLNNTRRILSTFYKYLENEEKIIINPMKMIPSIKVPKHVRKAFSDEEVEKLRMTIPKLRNPIRNMAIFELLLSSGLRLSELGGLRITDISLPECKGVCMGKGHKERVFYFSEKAKLNIQNYLNSRIDDKEWLWVSGNAPYNKLGISGIGHLVRQWGVAAEVHNVHPHRFRRTLSTRLIKKGMPIEQVSKILGHESLGITMRYIETDKELLRLTHQKHTN